MAIAIIMPKQGQSVASCIITEIYKKKGDSVKKGDIIFTYETDKASFEEESPVDGVVLECFYGEGDEVPVLDNMMVIGEPGEDYSDLTGEQEVEEGKSDDSISNASDENIDKIIQDLIETLISSKLKFERKKITEQIYNIDIKKEKDERDVEKLKQLCSELVEIDRKLKLHQ